MKFAFYTLVLLVCVTSSPAKALFYDEEVEIANRSLDRLSELFEKIERNVERRDLSRLLIIKAQCNKVKDSLQRRGLGNLKTLYAYQHLIVYFRYSFNFFNQIKTPENEKDIAEILRISHEISNARGFDDSPYTKITYNVFSLQINLIESLINNTNLNEDLKGRLIGLKPKIGRLLAVAESGDHRLVYEPAVEVYRAIEAMYGDFEVVARSDTAFDAIIEIQGLNEFYGEFAKIPIAAPDFEENEY